VRPVRTAPVLIEVLLGGFCARVVCVVVVDVGERR
jgi:hypothetical protein